MKKRLSTILFTLFSTVHVLAQNGILIPDIINFSKKIYESGNQNRAIDQDQRGLLYFANDDGLLVFDGTYWKTYPLPNGCIVRSLAVKDGRIYVGGQQEIGYFFFDEKGVLTYRSLKPLIPPGETEFTDVWRIVRWGNDVFFQSNKRIFRWHEGKIIAYKSINWAFIGASKQMLIAQEYDKGLMVFKNDQWMPLASPYDFTKDKVAMRAVGDLEEQGTFMATLKSGCYTIRDGNIRRLETPSLTAMGQQLIQSVYNIDTARIVIATRLGGYYIINTRGEIVQHMTKEEGLQSNAVNAVFSDKEKNIWLGLNNGIDMVVYNSPINHIIPSHDNKGPGYSASLYGDRLYVGTALGLYSVPIPSDNNFHGIKEDFSPVRSSNGLVWGLSIVNDQLLMGKNDGAFLIRDNTSAPIDSSTGFWSFQSLTAQQPSPRVIAGAYNGVHIYYYQGGKFINPKSHAFFESARNIVVMGDDIWVAHPYQGLYKIDFNDSGRPLSRPYADKRNILSAGHNHLFRIHDKIVLVTRKGIYEYDRSIRDFSPSTFFNKIFGPATISYLREDNQGNIWFIEDKKPGVVDFSSSKNPVIIRFPEINNRVLGNDEEFIYPIDKNNVLIASETGFYHIDYERYRQSGRDHSLRVLLRSVTAYHKRDSTLFGGYFYGKDTAAAGDVYDLKRNIIHKWNSIHVEFSSPYFGGVVEYSCRLKGYEREWSQWSKKTERTYTNLPAGNYEFEVMARNNTGRQSSMSRVTFTILPPWYETLFAYLVYAALIIAIIYFFYKRQQKKYLVQHVGRLKKQRERFEEEQRRQQYQHQLEIEKNEKEIIRLKNIKLEAEVEHNNAQLASNTMNLLQKRELLNKIKDEILIIQEEQEPDKRTKNVRRIIKIINEQLESIDDWERFSQYFDKSNNDFLKILKELYPQLTAADLKLCAYLRLNLSTKAIADLLNLSIRGVESSRYRLRKKLLLEGDLSLFDFLATIGSPEQSRSGNGQLQH